MNESMLVFTCACRCMVASLRWMSGILTKGLFASPLPNTCSFHTAHPRWSNTISAHQHARPTRSSTAHLPNFAHTETLYPSLHMPLQSSTLPSSAAPKILLHTISVCPPGFASPVTLLSHQPSTTRTRSKGRTKTASCCEAGPLHEANGFLGRPRRLEDLFSTTESLQVARHPLAHDWFQLASKFYAAKNPTQKLLSDSAKWGL